MALVETRQDWLAGLAPRVDDLDQAQREALAAHWSKLGQMEHASIAAFARFNLQLLALGAPAELVEQCNAALADETAHARICFGLASAYAGKALGPGPLSIDGSLPPVSLTQVVELVLAEGCFGEASAALEALEAADSATDPVIRATYARIAEDEQRHAMLAFRFLQWSLERDYETVSTLVSEALRSDLARSHAARSVVVPCLEALLASTRLKPLLVAWSQVGDRRTEGRMGA